MTPRAIRPSHALEVAYRRKLRAMVKDMSKSVIYWLGAAYRANEPEIAQDESPAVALSKRLKKVMRKWNRDFNERSKEIAEWFGEQANKDVSTRWKNHLKELGYTVKFTRSRAVNDVLQSIINEQVNLIKSIPQHYLTEVEGLVMRSVREGRDIGHLKKELQKRHGVTDRRAAFIARDQNNKASESISRVRGLDAGITHGRWKHLPIGKSYRKTHVAMNGVEFDLKEGLWDADVGDSVFPGSLPNCYCTWEPVFKGRGFRF